MTAEQKARELVDRWGIDGAIKRAEKIGRMYFKEGYINQYILWQSVREHILKLKNEGK